MAETEVMLEDDSLMDIQEDEAVNKLKSTAVRRKGRGFEHEEPHGGYATMKFDSYAEEGVNTENAQRSVEGWIVFVTGVHEEATDDDIRDKFSDFGEIKNLHLNLDRKTGFVKGYAFVEYASFAEAKKAIADMNNKKILGKEINCDWAFVKADDSRRSIGRGGRRRGRSSSPSHRY